ncbi:predicted protein [Streptomyces viridosporus ATCC 14672]|uniref:Predicted protein n=1 Tax=Streptomyces viridosporus (strain ATCC 14672 / DSM 40746 / JCM 4963 / KCTC 9882 / NRRL B-12104 / FH 1290) TaxID=566461 RepID=D5ZPJ6_STRV1|nr:predicted protein [Streptomyces viridosporus ATCC 14672]
MPGLVPGRPDGNIHRSDRRRGDRAGDEHRERLPGRLAARSADDASAGAETFRP